MTRARVSIIAAASGLTGMAAGFIGVGGGEFRLPVLVELLGFPLKLAGGINLVVGLFTVALSVYRRWGLQAWTAEDVRMVAVMGIASVVGAALGVIWRERLPMRSLKSIVCVYLGVVGVWMLYESMAHVEHVLLDPQGLERGVLAAVIGLAIAVVSGTLGIAGGEMRIPALLYLFALPIQEAGMLSLMVSLPTLASGALTDWRIGGLPASAIRIAVFMGVASAAGVLLGVALLPYADRDLLKGTLGILLVIATIRLASHPTR